MKPPNVSAAVADELAEVFVDAEAEELEEAAALADIGAEPPWSSALSSQ